MSLIPWKDTESTMGRLRTEMDRLFDRVFHEPWGPIVESPEAKGTWLPATDIAEGEKEVLVRAEVCGVDPKDLKITVSGNMLTIAGEKRDVIEEKKEHYYHCERRFGAFRRQIALPTEVDAENVLAECDNGLLTVRMKKAHAETARQIQVKAATRK